MTLAMLKSFFMWCTIINAGILLFSSLMMMSMADWAFSIHSRFFAIKREEFNLAVYSFLGLYKLFVYFFNLVPFIALVIVT